MPKDKKQVQPQTNMTIEEIASRLNVSPEIAKLWQRGFRRNNHCDENTEHYLVVGHAFDEVVLTSENAYAIGRRMARRGNQQSL